MSVYQYARSFDDIIASLPSTIRSLALELRESVQAALPDSDETIGGGAKLGMALYSIGGLNNVVCGIQPTPTHCKLYFHGWRSLVENGFVLDGSGEHARHVKVRNPGELEQLDVPTMLGIARKAAGF